MKPVADTNRIIAALVKSGPSRQILASLDHKFITPEFTTKEISRHKTEILGKSGIGEAAFDLLVALIFSNIEVIPSSNYSSYLKGAGTLMEKRDIKDAPFVALAEDADGIWSDDKDFEAQSKVRVYQTKDLIQP